MKKFIPEFIKALVRRMRLYWQRRYYYLAEMFSVEVPLHSISWVPDGFLVRRLGESPLRLVSNFCSRAEAAEIIRSAKELGCDDQGVLMNNVRSTRICAMGIDEHDGLVLSLLYRCSMLFGVPYTHCSQIVFAAIGPDSKEAFLAAYEPMSKKDKQHGLLLYLDEASGESVFEQFNLAVRPGCGRAVCWSQDQYNNQGVKLPLESPVSDGDVKHVLLFWFCDEPVMECVHDEKAYLQARKGEPLNGSEDTPSGVWSPQEIDLEGVFGQPDKMKGLV